MQVNADLIIYCNYYNRNFCANPRLILFIPTRIIHVEYSPESQGDSFIGMLIRNFLLFSIVLRIKLVKSKMLKIHLLIVDCKLLERVIQVRASGFGSKYVNIIRERDVLLNYDERRRRILIA